LAIDEEKAFLTKMVRVCRYDWLANKSLRGGYFLWAMCAYGFGENQTPITFSVVYFSNISLQLLE